MKKFTFYTLIALVLIFGTFIASYLLFIWNSYPKGWDAISHLFRIDFLRRFGPQTVWVFSWASGMPLFFLYPQLPYQILSIIVALSGQPSTLVLTFAAVFSVGLSSLFIFLLIKELTTSISLAFTGSILFITNPSSWGMAFSSGLYPRALAVTFFLASLWLAVRLSKNQNRLNIVLGILFVSLTVLFHFFVGAGALILLLAIIFVSEMNWGRKLTLILFFASTSLILTAYFLLPFSWGRKYAPGIPITAESVLENKTVFAAPSDFLYLFNEGSRSLQTQPSNFIPNLLVLHPFLTLLFMTLLVIFLFGGFWKRIRDKFGILFIFLIASLSCYFYSIFFFKQFLLLYGGILAPKWALYIMPFFIIPSISLLSYAVLNKTIYSKIYAIAITSLSIIWFLLQFPFDKPFPRIIPYAERGVLGYSLLTRNLNRNESNFRFGDANIAEIASWFNIEFPYVPQTRDYYNQGIVNPDYYFYLYYAGWETDKNWLETNFLFNWFGIKDFVVDDGSKVSRKFEDKKEYYDLIEDDGRLSLYLFRAYDPILSSRDTPAALIIGDKEGYNSIFRSLAYADINSSKLIPVKGENLFIDDYSFSELTTFPVLVLYNNYDVRNDKKATKLLLDYIGNGGTLYIEPSGEKKKVLQGIYKVVSKSISEWHMTSGDSTEIKINPLEFAPPVYQGNPWKVFQLTNKTDKSEVLLYESGEPILVLQKRGKGKIIWSGMNLPYHIVSNSSYYESNLLGELLTSGSSFGSQGNFVADFINTEKFKISLNSPAKGILFKENWFPNWKAYLDGKDAKIYEAGPGFMYLPLKDGKAGDTITFVFTTHPIQWIGYLISLVTLISLILWLFDWWIFRPYLLRIKNRLISPFKRASRWWGSEEG